jgi:CHASE3 domain sensor protein
MLFKVILFFNMVSLAMAIYMLVSYVKQKKNRNEHKKSG